MVRRVALLSSALAALLSLATASPVEARDHEPRSWDEREGWQTELAVGTGIGMLTGRDDDGRTRGVVTDTTIRFGLHRVGEFHEKNVLGMPAAGFAWCAPLGLCGPITLMFAPTSALAGNEVGFDVTAHLLNGAMGQASPFGFAIGVRPTLRVARDSRFRTASFLGALAPEVGVAFPGGRSREVYLEWSLYPVAATITRELAIEWQVLRERVGIPVDGSPVTNTLGTSLSFILL